ncbi:duplicated orphan permease [Bryocella elongata]|uniref:Duplicated orphan permease n=1 Tax=Bryocella elongata TaxID=863522 RepID=A0A1H5Z2X1_9BACT|nr:ABC transporter permease [Bryocella elongata]SEG30939.1 duplicated orphan permease [Bryocella elongata]
MHTIFQDLRFALRQLRRSPALAVTAVLTLALGIGANSAIFSLLDQALLRSLPVYEPQRLVILEGTGAAWDGNTSNYGGDIAAYFSYPMYKDLRDRTVPGGKHVFSGLITTAPIYVGISRNGSSETTQGEIVSGNYFTVLGVQPFLGRLLTQNDDTAPGANPVAVLSFDYWANHLGSNPSVVGQTLSLDGHPFQILGVAPASFRSAVWGQTPALFVPMSMQPQVSLSRPTRLIDHSSRWLNIIGRLQPGETPAQAETALAPLWHGLRAEELKALGTRSKRFTTEFLDQSRLRVLPGASGFSYQREDFQKPLLAIMGMAVLVLFIASVNVASLLLVRSASRVREFSLRYALGAGGRRILQQLLLEGLLIGIAGGTIGLILAPFALHALVAQLAGDNPDVAFTSSLDLRALIFNFTIALLVSVAFSLVPAMQIRRPNLAEGLGQKSSTGTGGMLQLRRFIVCLQMGLSVILLIGAGLFVRTMQNLRHVDVGFRPGNLITFGVNPRLAGYAQDAVPAIHQRILDTLVTLPGVQSVAATDDPELANNNHAGNVTVAGYIAPPDESTDVEFPSITPTYFSALQMPLVAGRSFTESDDANHPKVAIVNETFARHFCGTSASCVGRMMANGGGNGVKLDTQIVGVVHDARHTSVNDPIIPTSFRPVKQNAAVSELYYYLRSSGSASDQLPTIRRVMQQLDSSLGLEDLRTMDAQIEDSLSNQRLVAMLAVAFGILATVLAGVGIYGVLAFTTAQRTREIGIRIALGSSRLAIAHIVFSDVLLLAAIGIAIALPLAYGLSHLLTSQLFGVSPADPLTLLGAVLLITLVAFVAALLPAQRAASVNPTQALRSE